MGARRRETLQAQHDRADADLLRTLSVRGLTEDAEVLRMVRADVIRGFGERVSRLVLFGSRARGDHRPDSDWDIAVVLKDDRRGWPDAVTAGDVRAHILAETGELIDVIVVEETAIASLPHVQAALRSGIPL